MQYQTSTNRVGSNPDTFLAECWARDMSVSSTFSLSRNKGYSFTYQQITNYYNKKNDTFNTSFNAIFRS
jgi:hypothetical protein